MHSHKAFVFWFVHMWARVFVCVYICSCVRHTFLCVRVCSSEVYVCGIFMCISSHVRRICVWWCVYVKCLHMCRHSCVVEMFMYVACVWASESTDFHLIFWDWQGWISNESRGSSCLSFPTNVIDTLYWDAGFCVVVAGVQTRAIYLVRYFPSSSI